MSWINRRIDQWEPENTAFWQSTGRTIANRNLWISIFCLFVSFSIWVMWSALTVNLNNIGFHLSKEQLFNLVAIPGIVGATLRILNSFVVPIFGGRNWMVISTLLLLIPAFGVGYVVQDPTTSYGTLILFAALCGIGGGNFSSSMANVSFFFPKSEQGTALGLNAGFGNLGVSVLQLLAPFVIGFSIFGGASQSIIENSVQKMIWIQNISYIWIIPIFIGATLAFFFANNLNTISIPIKQQLHIFKRLYMYDFSWLYLASFGSFIGYSMAFPLLIKTNFTNETHLLLLACVGPLLGSLVRPFGGWLADHLKNGAVVTLWAFILMILGVVGVLCFLQPSTHYFVGFFLSFMLLFLTCGIANGTIFRMIGVTFPTNEKSTAVGFIAAIAAYGAFLSPKVFEFSLKWTGSVQLAFYGAILYYLISLGVTWYFHARKNAVFPG